MLDSRKMIRKAGSLFISLHRKIFLFAFSIAGLLFSIVWFSLGDSGGNDLHLWLAPTFFVFFLATSWSIMQHRKLRTYSVLYSLLLMATSLYMLLSNTGSIGVISFLLAPIIFFFIGGASASLIFSFATFILGATGCYILNTEYSSLLIGIVMFMYLIQTAGIFFLIAISFEYRSLLYDSKVEFRKTLDNSRIKESYMAGLSHRIRTPLSSIIGIADLMRSNGLNDVQQDLVEAIVTSANNLLTLSDEIMQQARIKQEGKEEKLKNEFDLIKILDDFADEINDRKGSGGNEYYIKMNYSQYLPKSLNGDSDILIGILSTILESIAQRATSGSLQADIYVYDKKETVNSLELLIELHLPLFHIVPEERLLWDGNADVEEADVEVLKKLGLIEIADQVTAKGGCFSVRHTSTAQTVVSFSLLYWKRDSDKLVADKIQQAIKATESKSHKIMEQATVLIVEDNLMNQKVVSMALKNRVQKVDIANNGKEAVMMFSSTKYDLILMDLMMPVMDGHKATEKIRELESGTDKHTPIIALTANARAGVKETCLSSGMDDYLTKPFKFDELIAKVEDYLLAVK